MQSDDSLILGPFHFYSGSDWKFAFSGAGMSFSRISSPFPERPQSRHPACLK